MSDENVRDDDVRATGDEPTSASQAPGHRRMRLVPLGVLAFLVAILGVTYALTTNEDPEQVAIDGDTTETDDPAVDGVTELAGTTWVLTEGAPIVDGWPITLTFEDDTFGGTAACNGYGGSYSIDGPSIVLGEIGRNSAACEERVMKSEEVFMSGLLAVDSFRFEGDRLVLSGAEPDLVFGPDSLAVADALVGVTWRLVEWWDAGESFAAAGTGAHLLLLADGTLEGGTGCRALTGTWIENGPEILFPSFGAEGECSEKLTRQDNQVVTVLGDGFRAELIGSELLLTSAGDERLLYAPEVDDDEPAEPPPADEVGFPFDETLTWSVILVEEDDVLNVRSDPGADSEIIGELEPYETGITAGIQVVDVNGGLWRQVHTASIPGGWVNERYLTAQPAGEVDGSAMLGLADAAVTELAFGPDRSDSISSFLSSTGVWIGGIGVFADFPFPVRRVPADTLEDEAGWRTPFDFTPDEMNDAGQACPECRVSPLEFVRLPEPDREFAMLVDHDLLADEGLAGPTFLYGPVADLHNMRHVTIDVPPSDEGLLDWQRVHLFFDWRTGEPLLHAIYTWGWTP